MGRTSELAPLAKNLHSLSSWDPKAHPLFFLVSAQISLSLLAAKVRGIRALVRTPSSGDLGAAQRFPTAQPVLNSACWAGRGAGWGN